MSYQRFNKGGRVAKIPFLAKSVQKSLNKKDKIVFFQKTTKVTFHIVNVKRAVL